MSQPSGQKQDLQGVKRARDMALCEGKSSTLIATGDDLGNAAGRFKKSTSTGLDLWSLAELAKCDKEDLDKLAGIVMEWDRDMVAPQQ